MGGINKMSILDKTSPDDNKFIGLCSKSFYGARKLPINKWARQIPTDVATIDANLSHKNTEKLCTDDTATRSFKRKSVKRKHYNQANTYSANSYGSKPQKERKTLHNDKLSSDLVENCSLKDHDTLYPSVASQTSFTSSQDSTEHSSPISSFRASPFINHNTQSSPLLFSSSFKEEHEQCEEIDTLDPKSSFTQEKIETCQELQLSRDEIIQEQPMLDTSFSSDTNSDIVIKSTRKTPQKNNTLFNYFKKSEIVRDSIKPKIVQNSVHNSKNSTRQCTLTDKKTSPIGQSTAPFELTLSPRQSWSVKKANRQKASLEKTPKRQKKEQSYIDVGQKDFGHVTCQTCGMIYTKCQEEDEAQHAKYHQKLVQKLKFNGWKNEQVVGEFHDGRIIVIKNSDHHLHLKKLAEVKDIVDTELGFSGYQDLYPKADQQAFLFISSKKVIGCAIALPVKKAYPVIPTLEASTREKESGAPTLSWCCSTDSVSALCGISRIWVFSQNRRQNIATRLVDHVRHHFLYGCLIGKNKIAFSDPTPNGRIFAERYTGRQEILVFR